MVLEELLWAIDCALACRTGIERAPTLRRPQGVRWAGQ
jgi:hypothetical protein